MKVVENREINTGIKHKTKSASTSTISQNPNKNLIKLSTNRESNRDNNTDTKNKTKSATSQNPKQSLFENFQIQ